MHQGFRRISKNIMSESGVKQALQVARENLTKAHQQYCQVRVLKHSLDHFHAVSM